MASVIDIHNRFLASIEETRTLFTYCRSPMGPYSQAGIESAFLDAFKAWEVFLDELIFAYLRGEPDISGNSVTTTLSLQSDHEDVYIKIMGGGRGSYIDWANADNDVIPRLKTYFDPPLDMKLSGGLSELREILKCRNAIAHSSSSASRRLDDLWTQKFGALKSSIRSADFLLASSNNPPLTWFEHYVEVLEILSGELVEI